MDLTRFMDRCELGKICSARTTFESTSIFSHLHADSLMEQKVTRLGTNAYGETGGSG